MHSLTRSEAEEFLVDFIKVANGSSEVGEVLVYHDGPVLFTAPSSKGKLLAIAVEDLSGQRILRYLVTQVEEGLLEEFRQGRVETRKIVTSGPMWMVQMKYEGDLVDCVSVQVEELVEEDLPEPGICLFPLGGG